MDGRSYRFPLYSTGLHPLQFPSGPLPKNEKDESHFNSHYITVLFLIEHQIEKSKRGVVAVVSVVLVVGVVVFVGAVVISTDFVGVVIFCFILVVSVMTFVLFFGSCYSCP